MQQTYSIDKFKIHQLITNREYAFCRIDRDDRVFSLLLNEIQYLCPISKITGRIYVEDLFTDGIPEKYVEFTNSSNTPEVLTVKKSNSANISKVDSESIFFEFNIKDRFQTKIDENVTLILRSAVGDLVIIPCYVYTFQILAEGRVQYQLRFNSALQNQVISA